jgi:hypothetical protein
MRPTVRIAALILVLFLLLAPLTAYASDGGPCPDDWEAFKDCDAETPPFYVVINRTFEDPSRPATGCQPYILDYPDCKACDDVDACADASMDLETRLCPELATQVAWTGPGHTEIVYEMCCACQANPAGDWRFRIRLLDQTGACPVQLGQPGTDPQGWYIGVLPPGTGVDLPVPVIVGGLALVGAGLLAAGVVVRRRTIKAIG